MRAVVAIVQQVVNSDQGQQRLGAVYLDLSPDPYSWEEATRLLYRSGHSALVTGMLRSRYKSRIKQHIFEAYA